MHRHLVAVVVVLLALARPAYAQFEFSGSWTAPGATSS